MALPVLALLTETAQNLLPKSAAAQAQLQQFLLQGSAGGYLSARRHLRSQRTAQMCPGALSRAGRHGCHCQRTPEMIPAALLSLEPPPVLRVAGHQRHLHALSSITLIGDEFSWLCTCMCAICDLRM